jgi:hypothetical protein
MKRLLIPVIIWMHLLGACLAAPDSSPSMLDGPNQAGVGELVTVQDTRENKGTSERFITIPPLGPRYSRTFGDQFAFTSPSVGIVSVAVVDLTLGEVVAWKVVTIGDGPGPVPPIPPVPPVPPLVEKVTKWVNETVPIASRGKTNALAKIYREASTSITIGRLATVDDAMAFVLAGSREAIDEDRDDWMEWASRIKTELDTLWDDGKLPDVKAYVMVFDQIAQGLERVQ